MTAPTRPARLRRRTRPIVVSVAAAATACAGLVVVPAAPAAATPPPVVVGYYTAVVAPPLVAAASSSSYAVRIRNASLLPITSVRVLVPTGFSVTSLSGANAGDDVWTLSSHACSASTPPCTGSTGTYLQADAPTHSGVPDPLWPLMSVVLSFQATAPALAGTYTWATSVASFPALSWLNLALLGPAPTTTVYANAAASLVLSGLPTGSVVAGTPFSATVTAVDSHGNLASGYRGTVHFALAPDGTFAAALVAPTVVTGAILPGDYTFTAGDAGRHTFSGIVLTSAPAQGFTVTDLSSSSVTGSAVVQVTPGPAASLDLSTPDSAIAGSSFAATVTARDTYGNVATGYTGTVHFTSDDTGSQTSLPADYPFMSGDAGTHGFSVTLTTAGNRSLTVTDGTRTAHASIAVAAGNASLLTIDAPQASVTAGDPFDVTVTVSDTFGNPVPGFHGTVHLTSSRPGATLPADYAFLPGDAGRTRSPAARRSPRPVRSRSRCRTVRTASTQRRRRSPSWPQTPTTSPHPTRPAPSRPTGPADVPGAGPFRQPRHDELGRRDVHLHRDRLGPGQLPGGDRVLGRSGDRQPGADRCRCADRHRCLTGDHQRRGRRRSSTRPRRTRSCSADRRHPWWRAPRSG